VVLIGLRQHLGREPCSGLNPGVCSEREERLDVSSVAESCSPMQRGPGLTVSVVRADSEFDKRCEHIVASIATACGRVQRPRVRTPEVRPRSDEASQHRNVFTSKRYPCQWSIEPVTVVIRVATLSQQSLDRCYVARVDCALEEERIIVHDQMMALTAARP
jgi:hypothetical protein